jgi:1,2-phenylacetyl-CoA epoxidase PaaB subunit
MRQKGMANWTVYKVRSLIAGGAGQSLERLGTIKAEGYNAAIEEARDAFRREANPALPQDGLAVILKRT